MWSTVYATLTTGAYFLCANYNILRYKIKRFLLFVCYPRVVKYLIIENVRSAYNVGAMFRTADGAGVAKIFLVGYTPTPIDRFGRTQSEIAKTSLGASAVIPWESAVSSAEVIKQLQTDGCVIVAIEQTATSESLNMFTVPEKVAYIMGNEVDGLDVATLAMVDRILEIPMHGKKESLNVSVAAGIVMYHGVV